MADIKEKYNKMYGAYKEEFGGDINPKEKPATKQLSCFARFLWEKNEKEILKKFVLAEAYKETLPDTPDFASLDPQSTLMKAIQGSFRGGDDYPKDTTVLTISANEQQRFQ